VKHLVRCLALVPCLWAWLVHAETPTPFELRDGDRIVFLGGGFIERDQAHGYLETILTSAHPEWDLTFRNLGWSGDTVLGEARAGFGKPEDGFQALVAQVKEARPTVLLIAYGTNESFAGEPGLPRFRQSLDRLLDALAVTQARMILIAPFAQEKRGPPLPDPERHNRDAQRYADAMRQAAAARGLRFVDPNPALFGPGSSPVTDDGLQLNAHGHWRAAIAIADGLGQLPDNDLRVRQAAGDSTKVQVLAERLPVPLCPVENAEIPPRAQRHLVWSVAPANPPRRYTIVIDGVSRAQATDRELAGGLVTLRAGPEFEQVERLRQAILEKNRLFFHRWRPTNETYLFGFRKHEQGQNAREIPQFDPLVAAQEREIARLRRPAPHVYQLVAEPEASQ
jgi:hypothetical protein